jgi:hypothetical protein
VTRDHGLRALLRPAACASAGVAPDLGRDGIWSCFEHRGPAG